MDNYPAGAAHDPQAPYNEQEVEVEVVATATMQQITTLFFDPDHYAVSDGGYEIPDIDLQEEFECQSNTLQDTLSRCIKVLKLISSNGKTYFPCIDEPVLINVPALINELQAWSQEEFKVERT